MQRRTGLKIRIYAYSSVYVHFMRFRLLVLKPTTTKNFHKKIFNDALADTSGHVPHSNAFDV